MIVNNADTALYEIIISLKEKIHVYIYIYTNEAAWLFEGQARIIQIVAGLLIIIVRG